MIFLGAEQYLLNLLSRHCNNDVWTHAKEYNGCNIANPEIQFIFTH